MSASLIGFLTQARRAGLRPSALCPLPSGWRFSAACWPAQAQYRIRARRTPMSRAMLLAIAVLIGAAAPAAAQDRMPPLAADQLTEAQKKAVDEFKAARSA